MSEELKEPKEDKRKKATPPLDEYAPLKRDFALVCQRGLSSFQETTPGRGIDYACFYLGSRYGTIAQTNEQGIPQIITTGVERDNAGNYKRQRFFIGLRVEVATKAMEWDAVDLKGKDTIIKDFKAVGKAYDLMEKVVDKAQKAGSAIQRKIDEEGYEWFPFFHVVGRESAQGLVCEEVDLRRVKDLMAVARQVVRERLGAKMEKCDVAVSQVMECSTIADHDGNVVDGTIPLFSFVMQVKTTDGNTASAAIRGAGGGMETLLRNHPDRSYEDQIRRMAEHVAKDAIDLDRAQGTAVLGSECPVIFSSHAAGVMAHEVFGHACESDVLTENRRSKTAEINLKGRIGGQVSDHSRLSMIDDGNVDVDLGGKAVRYSWGAIPCDDRGVLPTRTVIVDRGVLVGALLDRYGFNEVTEGLKEDIRERLRATGLSGNTRSEKFDQRPQVRMTCTAFLPDPQGPKSLEEAAKLISKTKKGVYVHRSAGGWVNTNSGDFAIIGALCYLIENGTVTDKPIKDVTISGNIGKFGSQIKAIGCAETISDRFSGICGKSSQYVRVDSAAPLVYVESAKIGGGATPWRFEKTLREYIVQMRQYHDKRRDAVSVQAVEEVHGPGDQSSLCMVTECLPLEEEREWLLGSRKLARYQLVGERLEVRGEA